MELEKALYCKGVMIPFMGYLLQNKSGIARLEFWIEAELYSHAPLLQLKEKSKLLIHRYFVSKKSPVVIEGINSMIKDLKKGMSHPTRDMFVGVQKHVWLILKYDDYENFKLSSFNGEEIPKDLKKKIKKLNVFDSLTKLMKNNKSQKRKTFTSIRDFIGKKEPKKRTLISFDAFEKETENMNFPEIEKIFEDEYLLLAFREYLYVTHSQENLSFWLEAEIFRRTRDQKALDELAVAIICKYINEESISAINIEWSVREVILSFNNTAKPNLFRQAQKICWDVLKNDLFPQFLLSDIYNEFCNNHVNFLKSDISRERSCSIIAFDKVINIKERIDSSGGNFEKEISSDKSPTKLQKKTIKDKNRIINSRAETPGRRRKDKPLERRLSEGLNLSSSRSKKRSNSKSGKLSPTNQEM